MRKPWYVEKQHQSNPVVCSSAFPYMRNRHLSNHEEIDINRMHSYCSDYTPTFASRIQRESQLHIINISSNIRLDTLLKFVKNRDVCCYCTPRYPLCPLSWAFEFVWIRCVCSWYSISKFSYTDNGWMWLRNIIKIRLRYTCNFNTIIKECCNVFVNCFASVKFVFSLGYPVVLPLDVMFRLFSSLAELISILY